MDVTVRFADDAVATLAAHAAESVPGVASVLDTEVAAGAGDIALRLVVRPTPPPLTVALAVVEAVRATLLSAGAEAAVEVGVTLVDVEP